MKKLFLAALMFIGLTSQVIAQITGPGGATLGPNIFTGQQTNSTNGAASTPPLLLNGTMFTGGGTVVTKPQLLIEPTGATSVAWNNNGTGFGVNAASGFTGLLADFKLDGVSAFQIFSSGNVTMGNSLQIGTNSIGLGYVNDGIFSGIASGAFALGTNFYTPDTTWTRKAAANWRMGNADIAAPVAQTLSVQGVVAGTSNTAGVNTILQASQGTGTGIGGSILLQVTKPGLTGTSQNPFVTGLTIDGTTGYPILPAATTVALLPACNAAARGALGQVSDATAPTYNAALTGGGAVFVPVYCNGTAWTSH